MPVNGIQVCLETFGEPTDPALLLMAGDAGSMDWWDDEFCRRLAAGGRFVIRYDHRDTGRSTSYPLGAAGYTGVDLMNDALGVLDALGVPAAHLVGFSLGGGLGMRLAVEHPGRVRSLTLIASTPGPGTPETAALALSAVGGGPGGLLPVPVRAAAERTPAAAVTLAAEADWTDRRAAVTRLVEEVRAHGGPFTPDEGQLRRLAERVFDRSADLAAARLHHRRAGFGPPVHDRLDRIAAPTLVLHGTLDRRFPPEHARGLARSIPGARLVWLEGVGHEMPPQAVWHPVVAEILGHTT